MLRTPDSTRRGLELLMSVTGAQAPASTRIARPIPLRESSSSDPGHDREQGAAPRPAPGGERTRHAARSVSATGQEALQGCGTTAGWSCGPVTGHCARAEHRRGRPAVTVRRLLEAESGARARNADDAGVGPAAPDLPARNRGAAADDVDGVVKANAQLHRPRSPSSPGTRC